MPARRDAARGAEIVYGAFTEYRSRFDAVTRRARQRFHSRNWLGDHRDGVERLNLYPQIVAHTLSELSAVVPPGRAPRFVGALREQYSRTIEAEPNPELAQTFFNSVVRKHQQIVGVDENVEYLSPESPVRWDGPTNALCQRFEGATTGELIRSVLERYRFDVAYVDLERDVERVAREVARSQEAQGGSTRIDAIETLRPLFYRDKAAYVVGRIRTRGLANPLVLPLHNTPRGIEVDAVLTSQNEVSILFSFARSHFHVEAEVPAQLIGFLKSIIPLKAIDELYTSLGFNKHGKTELYRSLQRHLRVSRDRFEFAAGARGMVMLVFALPYYDRVFKVIRDRFAPPKKSTRRDVMDRYRLVFQHDRVGRLIDAQEYEGLRFRRELFSEPLLEELLAEASRTVVVDGDEVVIQHLYAERKVTPLNLYIDRVSDDAARRAVIDYGHAIRELAAANIFPGDFLLKNFGVTRHGRVVFYDYDELCLLTECNFREMPPPRYEGEELESEPWFTVAEKDVFPEEFRKFLGLGEPLRSAFVVHHEELFHAAFWRGLQRRLEQGEILDFFPYPHRKRLHHQAGV